MAAFVQTVFFKQPANILNIHSEKLFSFLLSLNLSSALRVPQIDSYTASLS